MGLDTKRIVKKVINNIICPHCKMAYTFDADGPFMNMKKNYKKFTLDDCGGKTKTFTREELLK